MAEYDDYHTPDGGKTYHYGTDNPAECDECRREEEEPDYQACETCGADCDRVFGLVRQDSPSHNAEQIRRAGCCGGVAHVYVSPSYVEHWCVAHREGQ